MTSWSVIWQVPLSMGFSRQEYCSGLSFTSSGDFPDPGIEPIFPALESEFMITEPPGGFLTGTSLSVPSLSIMLSGSVTVDKFSIQLDPLASFKSLALIDRVPDELWTEVHDIVQKRGIKTITMGKKCKKAKWLSGEALQIAVKRREENSKGEKERYKHLNAEFQRIARRDKKAFLGDQCKEIEEKNRMGNTRDLFKKSRDTKGTFHAQMSSIKDRNCRDRTEAEDIKKR